MDNMKLLMTSLDFVENHLQDELRTEDIAKACYCSKSTLEKLFRCVNRISVHDYVVRRRMMLAAREIIQKPNQGIINIALKYGYSTNESFTRAFKSVWNCKPSEFRNKKYAELYPRICIPFEKGDVYMRNRKHVDISELYDLFLERKDCYFICCDIKSLTPINEISLKAGDLAILEAMNRMNNAAGEEDIVFRIGGDEFCMLTNSREAGYVEEIADNIRAKNEETFCFEGRQIPLKLHVLVTKLNSSRIKYDELFTKLHLAIKDVKKYKQ